MIFNDSKLEPLKINIGTKEELEILGFIPDRNSKILTTFLCIITGGLLLLLLSWKPSIRLKFTHIPSGVKNAKVLLVTDIYGVIWEENIEEEEVTVEGENAFRRQKYFYNKKIKYIWDDSVASFRRIRYLPPGTRLATFSTLAGGLNSQEVREKKQVYGDNNINIETPTVWKLFVSQTYNPFYIFQAYTILIWCLQAYYAFSACIFLLSVISIVLNVWETRRARNPLFMLPVLFVFIMVLKFILMPSYYEAYQFLLIIVGVSVLYFGSLFTVVYQIVKQTRVLREKMTTRSKVRVLRDKNFCSVDSVELVPGDVCIVTMSNDLLEADMVLLDGSAIMNEAILTGESVPVTKVHAESTDLEPFDGERHKKHVIHGGTQVLQVRGGYELKALVISTGYDSLKGEMIRSILFPKPMGFHIYSDFLKLILIFILLGVSATIWSLVYWSKNEFAGWKLVLFNSLDLMTFVIPPIIPATITSINLWAQKRLEKNKIFCLSSNYISLAGPTDIVCFDKTGTLTEDDLSLEGVLPCDGGEFLPPVENLNSLPLGCLLSKTLASCHSVAETDDGKFIGHPLDIKIFTALNWNLKKQQDSPEDNPYEMDPLFVVSPNQNSTNQNESLGDIAILKSYPFDSLDQRMTVIGQEESKDNYEVFIKGAPEKVVSICTNNSVPSTFDSMLEWYTKQGLRVIAAACATLQPSYTWSEICNSSREILEENSTFLGLIILQNRLKVETSPAIRILHQASITTVMVTGDNLLTATCVARQCGLIRQEQQLIFVKAKYVESSARAVKHLKIHYYDSQQDTEIFTKSKLKSVVHPDFVFGTDGESFELISQYDKETFRKLVHRGRIFARMKPDQKIEVIETLQQLGHQVAMCGDGCNDCGALKAAHSGISLSSTEASVAAPFTSLQQDISCVSTLIREGRATLISTYASFKYNISYCFSLLLVVIIMFTVYTEPSDTQYLIMDLVLITIPSLVMGNTEAANTLCEKRPSRRMLHPVHVISILSFLAIQLMMYCLTFDYLQGQTWYVEYNFTGSSNYEPSYEETVLILEGCFSFQIAAIVFSHGFPFRKPMYKNKILSIYLIISTTLCVVFLFCKASWMENFLGFKHIDYPGFTWTIFFIVILVGLFCLIWERWILYGVIENHFMPWVLELMGPRLPFEVIEQTINSTNLWPKLENYSMFDNDNSEEDSGEFPEEPLWNDGNDESSEKTNRFFRKSTKRYKFSKDDVKFVDEMQDMNAPKVNKIIYKTSSKEYKDPKPYIEKIGLSAAAKNPADVSHRASSDYVVPADSLVPAFHDQKSFRTQLFKGNTNGTMQTFGAKTKEPQIEDVEAYEIVPLAYKRDEKMYRTPEGYSPYLDGDYDDNDSVAATVEENDIQSPMSDAYSAPDFKRRFSNDVYHHSNNSDQDNLNKKAKTNQEEQNSSSGLDLIKEMNKEWTMVRSSIHESMKGFSMDKNDRASSDEEMNDA